MRLNDKLFVRHRVNLKIFFPLICKHSTACIKRCSDKSHDNNSFTLFISFTIKIILKYNFRGKRVDYILALLTAGIGKIQYLSRRHSSATLVEKHHGNLRLLTDRLGKLHYTLGAFSESTVHINGMPHNDKTDGMLVCLLNYLLNQLAPSLSLNGTYRACKESGLIAYRNSRSYRSRIDSENPALW